MKRIRLSAEQKVSLLRELLEEQRSVADLCEKYRIHPNQLYRWKKELFEGAVETFSAQRKKNIPETLIARLRARLKDRNEVIAELLEENLKLKKTPGEL